MIQFLFPGTTTFFAKRISDILVVVHSSIYLWSKSGKSACHHAVSDCMSSNDHPCTFSPFALPLTGGLANLWWPPLVSQKSLPLLRQSMISGKMKIEGIQAPNLQALRGAPVAQVQQPQLGMPAGRGAIPTNIRPVQYHPPVRPVVSAPTLLSLCVNQVFKCFSHFKSDLSCVYLALWYSSL